MKKLLFAVALVATLAACHHHGDDDNTTSTPPVAETPTPPPPSTIDAFFSYVSQVVANLTETDEPASTDGVAVTAPDNTEPQPLPAT
jgi:hypothetical protein